MDGRCSRAFRSSPGNRRAQSIVNLEGACTVTETLQLPAVTGRKLTTCNAKKLSGSDVGQNEASLGELGNFVIDFNSAAKIFQMTSKDISKSLSAAPQNGPALRVAGSHESQANGG